METTLKPRRRHVGAAQVGFGDICPFEDISGFLGFLLLVLSLGFWLLASGFWLWASVFCLLAFGLMF